MSNCRSKLPQELVDHVICYLQDDAKALCATSLVARAWVYCSQRLLHRCISISLPDLLILDRYSSPDLARFVHSLTVDLGWAHSVFDAELWSVMSRLTEIRRLSLTDNQSGPLPDVKDRYTSVFCRVSSLRLSSTLFEGPDIFLFFISLFPAVVELSMYGVGISVGSLVLDDSALFLPDLPGSQLRRIEVDPEGDEDLIRFLGRWFSALPIDVFNGVKLSCRGLLYPELLPALFLGMGLSLAHLSIDMSDFASFEEIDSAVSANTNLETLAFTQIPLIAGCMDHEDEQIRWVMKVVSSVSPGNLTGVTFKCMVDGADDIEVLPLGELDELLSSKAFQKLRQLSFVIPVQLADIYGGVWGVLQERLPRLHSKQAISLTTEAMDV